MRRKGFTLLELLIVIIIIGLLAAVGMVQYAKAVANTKNAQAKAILGEMRKAAMAYNSLNGTWPAVAVGGNISVDLDGDLTNDVTFTAPTGTDFDFTCAAAGTGSATKKASAGAGAYNWSINLTTGTLTSS